MSSTVQIAATAQVGQIISLTGSYTAVPAPQMSNVYYHMEKAQSVIKEYSLSEKLMTDALSKIEDELMKYEHYLEAAQFAKNSDYKVSMPNFGVQRTFGVVLSRRHFDCYFRELNQLAFEVLPAVIRRAPDILSMLTVTAPSNTCNSKSPANCRRQP